MKARFVAALFLACLLLFNAPTSKATQYTVTKTLSNTAFTDLGVGPMSVYNRSSNGPIYTVVSDTAPTSSTPGFEVVGTRDYGQSAHIWAIAQTGAPTILVTAGTPTISQTTSPATVTPLGHCQITAPTSATTLGAACSGGIPTGATIMTLVVSNAPIRFRNDGTAPTASVGTSVGVGQWINGYNVAPLSAFQLIQQSATAVVDIDFYK